MPLYEFACSDCGESFEKRVRLLESLENMLCPHCGGIKTEKKLSQFAVKGSRTASASTSSAASCSPGGT